jgi:RimJ/RimL family protein N-acetyltransferase
VTGLVDLIPEPITTHRLSLVPLEVADAADMVPVLGASQLYRYTGGEPPSLAVLTERYEAQVGGSGRAEEIWINWIMRIDGSEACGFIQASVEDRSSTLAWVVGVPWQRNGYASEAGEAVIEWLRSRGVERFDCFIHPSNRASAGVASRLGFIRTPEISDAEHRWIRKPPRLRDMAR